MKSLLRPAAAVLITITAALTSLSLPTPAGAASPPTVDGVCEGEILARHNAARVAAGLPRLREDPSIDQVARSWAMNIAKNGRLAHNGQYVSQLGRAVPGWTALGENVGYAPSAAQMHNTFMGSSGHRANILATRFQRIAVGCVRDASGRVWSTVNFVGSNQVIVDRQPTPFHSAGDASSRMRYWLLGAKPDAGRLDHDAGRLLSGQWDVDDLAVYLATSSLHEGSVPGLTRLYYATFLRHPDADGLNYWIRYRQDVGLHRVASIFAGSSEFANRYGSLDNRAFVDRIYRNVLDRAPESAGLEYWVGQLNRGKSRGQVLTGFSESAEFKTKTFSDVTVSWAFVQMLDRVPTTAERYQWTTALDSGTPRETLIRFLADSYTFASRAGSHSY